MSMNCFRRNCENTATVLPGLPCKDLKGRNVLWAMGVPHCDEHTVGQVVDALMTDRAWRQMAGMMRKEGLVPPDKATRLHFVPIRSFTAEQLRSLPS